MKTLGIPLMLLLIAISAIGPMALNGAQWRLAANYDHYS